MAESTIQCADCGCAGDRHPDGRGLCRNRVTCGCQGWVVAPDTNVVKLVDLRRMATGVKAALCTPGLTPYIASRAADLAKAALDYSAGRWANTRDCPSCKENGAEYERCKHQAQEQSDFKNAAYHERNQLVAALARLYPSGWRKTDIPGWDPEWHGCVFIDLPTGQASWHYHDREAGLFELLPEYTKPWDGHTTEEKYARLANLRGGYVLRRSGLDPVSTAVMEDVTRTGSVRAGHPRFYELLDMVAAMHAKKNSDYAKQADSMSNFRMCEAFGVEAWRGAMVRMSDKWARLTVLATKDRPSVSDETFEDTLMDLAAYALLVRILREEAAEAARLKRELVDGVEKLK